MSIPEPTIDGSTLRYFAFDLWLPDASTAAFVVFRDLAELFGVEYQSEAMDRLEHALRAHSEDLLADLDLDYEGSAASIHAKKPGDALALALVINELCVPPHQRPIDETVQKQLARLLQGWKRPRSQPWKEGDVFAAPLGDGSFAHGQVLAKKYGSPTCALLDVRRPEPVASVDEATSARVLAILHLGSDLLDQGVWRVLGNAPVVAAYDSGPQGDGYSVGNISYGGGWALVDIAEAFYGRKDYDWADVLMPDVEPPLP